MTTEYETIEWDFDEETGVGTIVLDRPDALNSLSNQLRSDIVAGFEAFEALDDEADGVAVRAVVIEGAGEKAFCAGADITEFDESQPGAYDLHEVYEVSEQFLPPVIAKIDGYCFGGGLELALSCDFRFVSERSTLGQPEIDLGIIPGGGGTQRLAEIVGPSRAKDLCMTGDNISGEEAAEEGIVDYVYPEDELDDAVEEFTDKLAGKPPLAIRAVKEVVNLSQEIGLEEGRMYEHRTSRSLRETEDHAEGAAAFSEDREPEWEGK